MDLLSREEVFKGHVFNVFSDQVEIDGKAYPRDWVQHNGAAAVVPILPNGDTLLIRQSRWAVERKTLEIVAGKLEPGETPKQCAVRELEEESGWAVAEDHYIDLITTIWPSPGYSSERIFIYLAQNLQPGTMKLDDDERIQIEVMPLEKARALCGVTILDGKSIVGLMMAYDLLNRR